MASVGAASAAHLVQVDDLALETLGWDGLVEVAAPLRLEQQRRYGERFHALAEFEAALRLAGSPGEQLVRGMHDVLTDGTAVPD